jgi:hypothetical protein
MLCLVFWRRPVFASCHVRLFSWLLHCRAVSRRSVALPRHVALHCAVVSHCHNTSCCLVVLSGLASSLHCAPLHISSHLLCLVGCCIIALCLFVASPHASHCRDLYCHIASCLVVTLRLVVISHCIVFCCRAWFRWLSHFLPSASCRMTSRRR